MYEAPHSDNDTSPPSFTDLPDLASSRVGAMALLASDEFFAEKENLLNPKPPVFIADRFTDRGKWMDGWETRRRRPATADSSDWCVIRLGLPGHLRGFDVDTRFFVGNPPETIWIKGLSADHPLTPADVPDLEPHWETLIPRRLVERGDHNFIELTDPALRAKRYTHLRLHMAPDGGIARFRVYGQAAYDWSQHREGQLIDLASMKFGARAIACNDMFFSPKDNIIAPWPRVIMADGWETRRRRSWNPPGDEDWIIVRLARRGTIESARIETFHFKGNFPDTCALQATAYEGSDDGAARALTAPDYPWEPMLADSRLGPHAAHEFDTTLLLHKPVTHVRLSIKPDGGISRLRLFGLPTS